LPLLISIYVTITGQSWLGGQRRTCSRGWALQRAFVARRTDIRRAPQYLRSLSDSAKVMMISTIMLLMLVWLQVSAN